MLYYKNDELIKKYLKNDKIVLENENDKQKLFFHIMIKNVSFNIILFMVCIK